MHDHRDLEKQETYINQHQSLSEGKKLNKGVVINYGEVGLQNGTGEGVKFYPYKNGSGKSFSHPEGGPHKVLE